MASTPPESARQERSHSESAAPRRSIFRDLLTPTDNETRFALARQKAEFVTTSVCFIDLRTSAVIDKMLGVTFKRPLISLVIS